MPRRKSCRVVPVRLILTGSVGEHVLETLGAIGGVGCCIVRVPLYEYEYVGLHFFSQINKSPAVLLKKKKKENKPRLHFSVSRHEQFWCVLACTKRLKRTDMI